ncbi:FKBP-type peptidyl-prolyl cis-trans isomerases 2 [Hahella chejuensis KCTC 2396]|uniref:Peptidyl-prolyl cis-trans isomerase n=1 Tax=Hahella chejuensis (strain KCTC 2396) TaxID=349521 RepID=Q2S9U1_HAHCH|nr:FKBP-type peptidyl-prolyl cis-trans isomerase [Hahella chejuensis]ABC32583.1 FKBP-type peptidyl-prolyl cis-trans isomerases 2 [Hahella chejuensis KCTC 2396]
MTEMFVGAGTLITLHFELRLGSGEVVDSTFSGQPGEFEYGDGVLPAGFEELLRGMRAGERKTFSVLPEKGFGMPNPNNVQEFPLDSFPDKEGLEVGVVMSFADAAKAELPGVIKQIENDMVTVDFNHPLAGHTLDFEVEILAVKEAQTDKQESAHED